jgi:hypothetical protein
MSAAAAAVDWTATHAACQSGRNVIGVATFDPRQGHGAIRVPRGGESVPAEMLAKANQVIQ